VWKRKISQINECFHIFRHTQGHRFECAVVLVCVTASPQALTHLSLTGEHEARLHWTQAGSVTNYPQEEAMLQSLLFQMQYILTDIHLWDGKYWNTTHPDLLLWFSTVILHKQRMACTVFFIYLLNTEKSLLSYWHFWCQIMIKLMLMRCKPRQLPSANGPYKWLIWNALQITWNHVKHKEAWLKIDWKAPSVSNISLAPH